MDTDENEDIENNPPDMDEGDPGSLAAQMDADKNEDIENNCPPGSVLDLKDLVESATLQNIRTALQFIQELKTASLDNSHLAPDIVSWLKNPPSDPVVLTPDEWLSLELFISTQNTAQHFYTSAKKAIEQRHPENHILTYDKVKQLTAEITGISPITNHMCIKSCVAYTGPFSALEACPVCGEPHFDSLHQLQQIFNTIPIGLQLQALKRNKNKAMALHYRTLHTEALLSELDDNKNLPKSYSNFFDGSQYLKAISEGLIEDNDIVLMLSLDGAQLFMSKQSDCWICIWVVFDHSPDVCYKKPSVLPAFVIPGPNPPQLMDPFLYQSLQHLTALQKDGLCIWDGFKEKIVTSYPFFTLGTMDGPGLTHLNGLVGHMGRNGCHLYCSTCGRQKP